ncbi:MAG: phosphatidylglycerophosphatase A [Pseudomonadota bacterium]
MSERVSAKTVFSDPVHILAFGFGTGLSPFAPGTVGTLVALPIAWLTLDLGLASQIAVAALLILSGIWICGESAKRIGVHDHGGIVWDEVAGMYVTLLLAPPTILGWALAFLAFRLFDIVKPWPIRDLDHRMKGGLGIMLDDIAAALYAMILLAFYGWFMN